MVTLDMTDVIGDYPAFQVAFAAIGGMAAQIPIKNDADANDAAMAKVRADKEREVTDLSLIHI